MTTLTAPTALVPLGAGKVCSRGAKCVVGPEPQPLSAFNAERRRPGGRRSECRACEKAYRVENAEAIGAQKAGYYAENAATIKAQMRAYGPSYYAENAETIKAATSARRTSPEGRRKRQIEKARRKARESKIPLVELVDHVVLFARFDWRCAACSYRGPDLQHDHVIAEGLDADVHGRPSMLGTGALPGEESYANAMVLCGRDVKRYGDLAGNGCNQSKNQRPTMPGGPGSKPAHTTTGVAGDRPDREEGEAYAVVTGGLGLDWWLARHDIGAARWAAEFAADGPLLDWEAPTASVEGALAI